MLSTWPLVCFMIPCKLMRLKAASASTREFKLQRFYAQRSAHRDIRLSILIQVADTKLRPEASGVVYVDQVHMTLPQVKLEDICSTLRIGVILISNVCCQWAHDD
jgi:hypothetical protein